MSTNIDELLDEDFFRDNKPQGRPVFLTVLCILTFVGCGLLFILNFIALAQFISQRLPEENTTIEAISLFISMGSTLLCLVGAILMLRLRRAGFFLYIIGESAPLVYSLVMIEEFYYALNMISFAGYLVPVAFIVMYSMNYKHLK